MEGLGGGGGGGGGDGGLTPGRASAAAEQIAIEGCRRKGEAPLLKGEAERRRGAIERLRGRGLREWGERGAVERREEENMKQMWARACE